MSYTLLNRSGLLATLIILAACGTQQSSLSGEYDPEMVKVDAKSSGLSLSISQDDPGHSKPKASDITSVVINVDHMRLVLAGGDKIGRLSLTPNSPSIDLMNLGPGLALPLANAEVPRNIRLKQIRLVLAEDGNFLQRADGSICQLKTPSQQKSGLKIKIGGHGLTLEGGTNYRLALNFNPEKSIVLKGNGGCSLKPVIHLKCHKHKGKKAKPVSCEISTEPPDPNEDSDESPEEGNPTDGEIDDNDLPPIEDPFLFF